MSDIAQPKWETTIQPNRKWFYIDFKELYAYRDLILLLVRRDFVSKYKQTILGPAWAIISPVLSTMGFLIIKFVLKTDTGSSPAIVFFMCGQLGWVLFSTMVSTNSNVLRANAGMFGKVYFPRIIPPIANSISSFIGFGIQSLSFAGLYLFYLFVMDANLKPNAFIFFIPVLLLHTWVLAMGVGLLLSAVTAKYRDFAFVQQFILNLGMFATPIIWPFSNLEVKWQFLASLNPMAMIVEGFKRGFLVEHGFQWSFYANSLIISFAFLFIGLFSFRFIERTFVDTV